MPTRPSIKSIATTAILAILLSLAGCDRGRESQSDSPENRPPIGKLKSKRETFERQASGCTEKEECASVSITREVFEQRPALNRVVLQQMIHQLQGNGEDQTSANSLEELADNFLAEAAKGHGESSARWQLTGEAKRFARRDDLLTVEINSYIYTGGAHGMPAIRWLNWDLAADEEVPLDQVIREGQENDFWGEARGAHRRWLDEQPGTNREFRETWPFRRSNNFRFDDQGLVLLYNVYALGPYVLGPVELTIPWKDLRGIVHEQYLPEEQ
ncbi:DUF3298 and DUF4163 domain-containing protein [Microbulbifer rhizosphaerae]|uniref:DUF3298 domain-containing protein n=1 Tax=Microbulbifer rhizosphaerae TaxID=1562603 RepID=A0A7W4WE95_9GAMM|nr:DUF3298 and DUF4163 domain-containing protein [Microbulbifer rhizosphaerae]MBB3062659.1 hypothetical protein [Microbulbifer rhizosphaerae]